MKRTLLIAIGLLICVSAYGQCYEPNIKKADAEYAKGNYFKAYEYYDRATKCPDANRFENGKLAKAGKKNVMLH